MGRLISLGDGGLVRAAAIAGIVQTSAEEGRILLLWGGELQIPCGQYRPILEAWTSWLQSPEWTPLRLAPFILTFPDRAVTHDDLGVVILEEHDDRSQDRWQRAI